MNQNLVAWSCRGMCGTKLKNPRALVLCHVVSCVEYMWRLLLKATVPGNMG